MGDAGNETRSYCLFAPPWDAGEDHKIRSVTAGLPTLFILKTTETGGWKMQHHFGRVKPFEERMTQIRKALVSSGRDGGVHQNITHAVHPDPISGMHCWHQRVRIEKPQAQMINMVISFVDTKTIIMKITRNGWP